MVCIYRGDGSNHFIQASLRPSLISPTPELIRRARNTMGSAGHKDISSIDETSFPYTYEENVNIHLASQTEESRDVIRCNVYRPKGPSICPVLVTYGPYGKDIHYRE